MTGQRLMDFCAQGTSRYHDVAWEGADTFDYEYGVLEAEQRDLHVVFTNPAVFELKGFGFTIPQDSVHFALRHPTVVKWRFDMNWKQTVGFDELQNLALEAGRNAGIGLAEEVERFVAKLTSMATKGRDAVLMYDTEDEEMDDSELRPGFRELNGKSPSQQDVSDDENSGKRLVQGIPLGEELCSIVGAIPVPVPSTRKRRPPYNQISSPLPAVYRDPDEGRTNDHLTNEQSDQDSSSQRTEGKDLCTEHGPLQEVNQLLQGRTSFTGRKHDLHNYLEDDPPTTVPFVSPRASSAIKDGQNHSDTVHGGPITPKRLESKATNPQTPTILALESVRRAKKHHAAHHKRVMSTDSQKSLPATIPESPDLHRWGFDPETCVPSPTHSSLAPLIEGDLGSVHEMSQISLPSVRKRRVRTSPLNLTEAGSSDRIAIPSPSLPLSGIQTGPRYGALSNYQEPHSLLPTQSSTIPSRNVTTIYQLPKIPPTPDFDKSIVIVGPNVKTKAVRSLSRDHRAIAVKATDLADASTNVMPFEYCIDDELAIYLVVNASPAHYAPTALFLRDTSRTVLEALSRQGKSLPSLSGREIQIWDHRVVRRCNNKGPALSKSPSHDLLDEEYAQDHADSRNFIANKTYVGAVRAGDAGEVMLVWKDGEKDFLHTRG